MKKQASSTKQHNSYSHQLIKKMESPEFDLFQDFESHLTQLQKTGGIIGVVKKSLHINPVQTAINLDKFGIRSEDIKKEILNQSFYNHMKDYLTSQRFSELPEFVTTTMKKFLSKYTKLDILLNNLDNIEVLFTNEEVARLVRKNYLKNKEVYEANKDLVDKLIA